MKYTLKQSFKKVELLDNIIGHIRCYQTKRRYYQLRTEYERKISQSPITSNKVLLEQRVRELVEHGFNHYPLPKGNLRLIWVGADPDQDSSGILQGLGKFGQVEPIYQVWPKQYDDIRKIRRTNGKRLVHFVNEMLKDGPVNVVIGQMWNMSMDHEALHRVRMLGIPVVNIAMDDRHTFRHWKRNGLWTGTYELLRYFDLACTAAKECTEWYRAEGCPSIYLPEASDPEIFIPSNEKIHDVCFVGARYGIREKIVTSLINGGINVTVFGAGWPNGRIDTGRIPELFAKSHIVLGVGTIRTCEDFFALKMRDFDGPMSGSLYLTHHNPDLEELYLIGKEIETYRNIDECVDKARFYLQNPDKAVSIGRVGRARAESEHTWEKRFEVMLKTLGLIQS